MVLLALVRFGVRHRRIWTALPFALLAIGVFGFARLADHYAWGSGTTFLIGTLMLAIFVMVVGPLAVLPDILRKMERVPGSSQLLRDLEDAAHKLQTGSVSTRKRARIRRTR